MDYFLDLINIFDPWVCQYLFDKEQEVQACSNSTFKAEAGLFQCSLGYSGERGREKRRSKTLTSF